MAAKSFDVDVAIIGAGIQGLWTLHEARRQGLSAVVFSSDVSGESLHGHEFVGSGYVMNTNPELSQEIRGPIRQALSDVLAKGGVPFPHGQLLFVAQKTGEGPFTAKVLTERWTRDKMSYRELSTAELPAVLRTGLAAQDDGVVVFETPDDFGFDWREALRVLLEESSGMVKRGTLTKIELTADGTGVGRVEIDVPQVGTVGVRPKQLVLATGAWTPSLIGTALKGADAVHVAAVVDRMRNVVHVDPVPMLCVRGPESIVPLLGLWNFAAGPPLAWGSGYVDGPSGNSRDVTWFASALPFPAGQDVEPDSGFRPEHESTADKSAAISAGITRVFSLAGGLKQHLDKLRFGFYFGWKCDNTHIKTIPKSPVTTDLGLANLQIIQPVAWGNAISCGKAAVAKAAAAIKTPSAAPDLSGLPAFVLGPKHAATIEWLDWAAFAAKYNVQANL